MRGRPAHRSPLRPKGRSARTFRFRPGPSDRRCGSRRLGSSTARQAAAHSQGMGGIGRKWGPTRRAEPGNGRAGERATGDLGAWHLAPGSWGNGGAGTMSSLATGFPPTRVRGGRGWAPHESGHAGPRMMRPNPSVGRRPRDDRTGTTSTTSAGGIRSDRGRTSTPRTGSSSPRSARSWASPARAAMGRCHRALKAYDRPLIEVVGWAHPAGGGSALLGRQLPYGLGRRPSEAGALGLRLPGPAGTARRRPTGKRSEGPA
jgi:hypothetical protein